MTEMTKIPQPEIEAYHAGYQAGYENGKRDAVKRGEWITKEPLPRTYGRPRSMCGRCGAFALYEFINVGSYAEKLSTFCPGCGARMDGKESGE